MEYKLGRVGIKASGAYTDNQAYEALDMVSFNGSSYIARKATQGNQPTNSDYWMSVALMGANGPQGLRGDVGAVGPQGPKGDVGAVGAQGPKGDTGSVGAQGPKGDTGAVGIQGPKGDTGAVGAQGPKGDVGATGPQGIAGAAGKSAYQSAQAGGYSATEATFNADLAAMNTLAAELAAL